MSREEYLAKSHIIEQQTVELQPLEADGFILDIGGGGEGIIGKLNGRQVAAIDKRPSELEEVENESLKIIMDATDLKFLDETFGVVTSFFTMMYIPKDQIEKIFAEAHRVLRRGGRLLIWDVKIPERVEGKKHFVLPLRVILPDEEVETGYGVRIQKQDQHTFKEQAAQTGLEVSDEWEKDEIFFLELRKP
ncbi:MAG: class I SAM-dependent methyltransferase [Candidatus Bathyarchaeota archaeon]|nr:MAG: class I SAM-dependent methyltransferase [Candidatus Bathyarchaeota archaeon]